MPRFFKEGSVNGHHVEVVLVTKKIAILIHSFFNTPESMIEVEEFLRSDPVLGQQYDEIWRISYYDSERGLDQTKPHNLFTPIYEHDDPEDHSLTRKAFEQIEWNAMPVADANVRFDLIGHSLGGLIIRCLIQYFSERKNGHVTLAGHPVENLILLGTANRGSSLASRLATATLPLQLIIDTFKLIHDLADAKIDEDDLFKFYTYEFHQFSWQSDWIKRLNRDFKSYQKLRWATVRGVVKSDLLSDLWNGLVFWRIQFRKEFPFIHFGPLPNDGIIEARSVPLPGAKNFTVKPCAHHELVQWKNSQNGVKVAQTVKSIL